MEWKRYWKESDFIITEFPDESLERKIKLMKIFDAVQYGFTRLTGISKKQQLGDRTSGSN